MIRDGRPSPDFSHVEVLVIRGGIKPSETLELVTFVRESAIGNDYYNRDNTRILEISFDNNKWMQPKYINRSKEKNEAFQQMIRDANSMTKEQVKDVDPFLRDLLRAEPTMPKPLKPVR